MLLYALGFGIYLGMPFARGKMLDMNYLILGDGVKMLFAHGYLSKQFKLWS